MATHKMQSGEIEFEVLLDDDGRISDVVGPWPEADGEVELTGVLPPHAKVGNAPEHINSFAEDRGMDVCFYDGDGCRTCFCVGERMTCIRMC
ncbi:MAG TPA: hypothetical protein VIG64_03650 [Actinomycetota bacterium]